MQRGAEIEKKCCEKGLWARNIGDAIVISPPLINTKEQLAEVSGIIQPSIRETD